MDGLMSILIAVLVISLILAFFTYVAGKPTIPEPFRTTLWIVVIVVIILIVLRVFHVL